MGDPIFQRSLQDLIKGIRSNKKDSSGFISQAIGEIKNELRSVDPFLKSEAVRKLTYLQMIGYNVSWASFSIVEVMSQPRFAHKRIAYLAANQTFDENTDVILLTTNLFKKEFSAQSTANQYELGLAINCLANIATKELARDCIGDLVQLTTHARPYVRKKAILAMYKLYVKYPQGLRLTFEQLKERLDDAEPSVVSTAVNVICELAHKNAKNYLAMAPQFFRLLTTSANNWMLIKVVKLLGALVVEEPRLARKLLDPLSTIIASTAAKSLEYECIYTLTEALPHSKREDGSDAKNAPQVVALCSTHLRRFLEENDPNLKYLGLVGLCNLMRTSPRSVVEHRDLVLACLGDEDTTIRVKALELIAGIVSQKSLEELVQHLLQHADGSEGKYREEVIAKILQMCRKDKYACVTDFCWYVSVLLRLAHMQGAGGAHGREIADQLIEIALRVDAVRAHAVDALLTLLLDAHALEGGARDTLVEVLRAAVWIIGEYPYVLSCIANDTSGLGSGGGDGQGDETHDKTAFWIEGAHGEERRSAWRGQSVLSLAVRAVLHARMTSLPAHVQCVCVHSAMKLFVHSATRERDGKREGERTLPRVVSALREGLSLFLQSTDLEVQERASSLRALLVALGVLCDHTAPPLNAPTQPPPEPPSLIDMLHCERESERERESDVRGAARARESALTLAALCAEPFYAVHAKAQRRVPAPSFLASERAALQKVLSLSLPEPPSLSTLSLLREREKDRERDRERPRERERDAGERDKERERDRPREREREREGEATSLVSVSHSHGALSLSQRPSEDDVFILSARRAANGPPNGSAEPTLSRLLGEAFERERERPREREREKKKKKSRRDKEREKERERAIDVRDMLPAGAATSSDEERERQRESAPRREKERRRETERKTGDEMDLGAVDITTPLRADEVITQPTHRSVTISSSSHKESKREKSKAKDKEHDVEREKDKKKDKKPKKKRGESSHKTHKTHAPTDDLLSLDWPAAESLSLAPSAAATVSVSVSERAPQRLLQTAQCVVSYSVSCVDCEVTVDWECVSVSREPLSLTLSLPQSVGGGAVELARGLSGGVVSTARSVFALPQPCVQRIALPCSLSLSTSTAPSPTVLSASVALLPVSAFKKYRLGESEFREKIAKSSRKWCTQSLTLRVESESAQNALHVLATLLHAHVVELTENAATLSAKSPSGCKVFVLAKVVLAAPRALQVDVKCLGASEADSQQVALAVTSSLADIVL